MTDQKFQRMIAEAGYTANNKFQDKPYINQAETMARFSMSTKYTYKVNDEEKVKYLNYNIICFNKDIIQTIKNEYQPSTYIEVVGQKRLSAWVDKNGEEREQLEIVISKDNNDHSLKFYTNNSNSINNSVSEDLDEECPF